jgi:hypothetical protein
MTFSNEQRVKVIAALENPKYKWRTVLGAARESGVPEEQVQEIIVHTQGLIVQSSVPSNEGEPLFTTRRHLRKYGTPFERLMGAFKNRAV